MKKLKKEREQVEEKPDIKIPETADKIIQGKIIRVDADNGHFYQSEKDQSWKKSLTYILDAGFPISFGLKEFYQTHTKEEADAILNDTGLSGSKLHHTIHLMNMKQSVSPDGFTDEQTKFLGLSDKELIRYLKAPFSKDEDKKMKGYKQFVIDFKLEMIEHERILISDKYDFGCTLDAYCKIQIPENKRSYKEFAGKVLKSFIDYKTGKGIYYKNEVQIVMCGQAYRENVKKTRGDIHAILHLGVNTAGYKFKIVKNPKKAIKDFMTVKDASEIEGGETEPRFYEFEAEYKL